MKTLKLNKLKCLTNENGLLGTTCVKIKSSLFSKEFRKQAREIGAQYRKVG